MTEIVENKNRRREPSESNQSLIWIGVLAAAALVFLAGYMLFSGGGQEPLPAAFDGSTSREARTLTDAGNGFSLDYPSDWDEMGKKELTDSPQGFDSGVQRSRPQALVGVRVAPYEGEGNLSEIARGLDEKFPEEFQEFEKVDHRIVKQAGLQGLEYTYAFKSSSGDMVKQRQLIIISDGKVYYVVAHASVKDFDKLSADVAYVMDSFRLN